MKVRIPKNRDNNNDNNDEKKKKEESVRGSDGSKIIFVSGKENKRGLSQEPLLAHLKKSIRQKIEMDIEKILQASPEDTSRGEVLVKLATRDAYANSFNPPKVRKNVKIEVSNLLNEEVISKVDQIIQNAEKEKGISYETIVKQLERAVESLVSSEFEGFISDYYLARMQKALDQYAEKKLSEYEKKIEERKILEQEELKKQEEELEKQEQLLRENEPFFCEARDYTDNFKFLATDILGHIANTGYKEIKKFSNFEYGMRFLNLQDKLREIISSYRTSESRAISILIRNDKSLDEQEIRILESRLDVLSRENEDNDTFEKKVGTNR